MPCGDLKNQYYSQVRAKTIYMCADPALFYSKGSCKGDDSPCYAWEMIVWMTTPRAYVSPYYEMTQGKEKWGKELKDKNKLKKGTPFPTVNPSP
jgi:hypothetical protein